MFLSILVSKHVTCLLNEVLSIMTISEWHITAWLKNLILMALYEVIGHAVT
jgi:hypothetical protein